MELKVSPTHLMVVHMISVFGSLVAGLVSMAFLWWYRKSPIVAIGQPQILAIMCFGVVIYALGLFFDKLLLPEGSETRLGMDILATCRIGFWLTYIGWFSVIAVVMCKLYRVYKIMQFRKNNRILLWHAIWPLVVVFLILFVLCIISDQLSTPTYILKTPTYPDDAQNIEHCAWYTNDFATGLGYSRSIFFGIILFIVMIFAWKLRNVKEELGESHRIFWLSSFIFIQLILWWVIQLTMQYADIAGLNEWEKYCVQYLNTSLYIIFFNLAAIVALVVPRMYSVWHETKHGDLPWWAQEQMYGSGSVSVSGRIYVSTNNLTIRSGVSSTTRSVTTRAVNDSVLNMVPEYTNEDGSDIKIDPEEPDRHSSENNINPEKLDRDSSETSNPEEPDQDGSEKNNSKPEEPGRDCSENIDPEEPETIH